MPEDTFYLKIETTPEKFEAELGEVSIPSVYYKRLLPNQKGIMRCSDVRLRKTQPDKDGWLTDKSYPTSRDNAERAKSGLAA